MTITAADFAFDTTRLRTRPINEGDEALYSGLYTDAANMRLIGPPLSMSASLGAFRHTLSLQESTPMRWLLLVIEDKESGQAIGLVGTPHFDPEAARLEMGLMLHRSAHGKGYPREVLTEYVRSLFATVPVLEIWTQYPSTNAAADRAVRAIGFEINKPAMVAAGDEATCVRSAYRATWKGSFFRPSLRNQESVGCPAPSRNV